MKKLLVFLSIFAVLFVSTINIPINANTPFIPNSSNVYLPFESASFTARLYNGTTLNTAQINFSQTYALSSTTTALDDYNLNTIAGNIRSLRVEQEISSYSSDYNVLSSSISIPTNYTIGDDSWLGLEFFGGYFTYLSGTNYTSPYVLGTLIYYPYNNVLNDLEYSVYLKLSHQNADGSIYREFVLNNVVLGSETDNIFGNEDYTNVYTIVTSIANTYLQVGTTYRIEELGISFIPKSWPTSSEITFSFDFPIYQNASEFASDLQTISGIYREPLRNSSFTTPLDWLVRSVDSFLSFEIFPNFSLSSVIGLVFGLIFLIIILKIFFGG